MPITPYEPVASSGSSSTNGAHIWPYCIRDVSYSILISVYRTVVKKQFRTHNHWITALPIFTITTRLCLCDIA